MMSHEIPPFTPRIAVTMGDPCGVGPEILVKALASIDTNAGFVPVVIGSFSALERARDLLAPKVEIRRLRHASNVAELAQPQPGVIYLLPANDLTPEEIIYGRPGRAACETVVASIRTGVELALDKQVDALCTCPIHKANLHRHGFEFPGHTEFLRDLTGAASVVMMLAGPRLRVSLVTIHHAVAEVPKLLNKEILETTLRITAEAMFRDFGLKKPRIAVAALNPHAGEEGRFGREEIDLIGPVIERFPAGPWSISGPYPPDTLFFRAYEGEFDAVVAMYHDQGLIPIKLAHFHEAVNISLGLPIIRTSVDHGTAYDLAGTGKANDGSLRAALELAAFMARNRRYEPDHHSGRSPA